MMSNVDESGLMVDTAGDDLMDASHGLNANGQSTLGEGEPGIHFWSNPFLSTSVFDAWRKYARGVVERVSPAVRRSAEVWIRVGQENSRLTAKLLNAALETGNVGQGVDIVGRAGKFWQETVGAFQETISAAAQANAEVVELWSEAIRATVPESGAEAPSTVLESIGLYPSARSTIRHEQIQRLAYELWERKGRRHGMDWEDWFEAEAALRQFPRLAA